MIYILHRLSHTVVILFGVTLLVFILIRLSGDPAALYLPEGATEVQISALRERLGLDQPLHVQYGSFVLRMIRGDFGISLWHRRPALELVLERLPATIELTLVALAFAMVIAVPAGVFSAVWRNSMFDSLARIVALLGLSIPNFWLGIMLILLFSVNLRLLPAFGRGDATHLILPGIALGSAAAGTIMRLVRSNVLETLHLDFVRTARAKGLPERVILTKHVLRNSAIPALTFTGLQLGYLLSGSIVTETVFGYPGVGRLAVQAINNRDFAVVQAFVAFAAIIFALANMVVDLLYTLLDPRIRY
jgi:ABC-type dipeptide/oligopeptide/nickel transport system permease component